MVDTDSDIEKILKRLDALEYRILVIESRLGMTKKEEATEEAEVKEPESYYGDIEYT